LFKEMRLGLHEESSYSLRAKIDYKHPNTTLRDPVIYRIRYHEHPHVGNKWCIYPLYDYAHPICDSLEGITHSLCSLEFEIRRELYYWTLEKLDLYRAHQWEFSRLNITYTVLSKRRLHELIAKKYVAGWDDPRLLTINGMRRRGYTAEILNNFCDATGVTRRGNENYIQFGVLENEARRFFDLTAPRTMAVLQPVELLLEDLAEPQTLTVPLFPKQEERGARKIQFSKRIFVELSDVKLKDEKGFYGIAPNKVVGLKYAQPVLIKEIRVQNGEIKQIIAALDQNVSH
jgi:glutaminyl-tRNA synthetase